MMYLLTVLLGRSGGCTRDAPLASKGLIARKKFPRSASQIQIVTNRPRYGECNIRRPYLVHSIIASHTLAQTFLTA